MFNKKQENIIYVDQGDKPSRFLVDLNKTASEQDKGKKKKNILSGLFNKIAEFDFKFLATILKKLRCGVQNLRKSAKQSSKKVWSSQTKANGAVKRFEELRAPLKSWHALHKNKFNHLAFFPFVRLFALILLKTIKLFYKLCHAIGWIAVFLVRFFLLLIASCFKLFFNLFKVCNFKGKRIWPIIKIIKLFAARLKIIRGSWGSRATALTAEKTRNKLFKLKLPLPGDLKAPSSFMAEKCDTLSLPQGKHAKVKALGSLHPALSFALILLILILPFKAFTYYKDLNNLRGNVLNISGTAINELAKAGGSISELRFDQASQNFSSASSDFLQAQNELDKINDLLFTLASFTPNQGLKMAAEAKYILAAGQAASVLGGELSLAMDGLFGGDNNSDNDKDLGEILNSFNEHGGKAAMQAKDLKMKLDKINADVLPAEYREQFIAIRDKAVLLENGLSEFVDLISKMRIFIGLNQNKRYLLVFQNNTEIRASGGFIGSYALVDFSDGKIKNIEAPGGGSYDTEGGLLERIIAPEPLHLVNPLWHFWDANWWPDWPSSARKLMWFYEKSDGATVDGIISFTPTVAERILEVIGPIDMAENYDFVINAENFWLATQQLAERKQDETKEPKKIIGDLLVKIIEELPKRLDKDTLIDLIRVMEKNLNEKHILFYFNNNNDDLQKKAEDLGWDGKIKQTAWDYLMVVNTNIAGGKSDRKIKEKISHIAEAGFDGAIINTVEIKRIHTGIKNEPFCGTRNVDWMRIYVPLGSELIEARGFREPDEKYFGHTEGHWRKDPDVAEIEDQAIIDAKSGTKIYNELGKTVFANWSMVDPGYSVIVYLKYKLPFKLNEKIESQGLKDKIEHLLNPGKKQLFPYAFLAQKQPGSIASEITSSLKLFDNFKVVWKYPEDTDVKLNGWDISDELAVDKYWAVLITADSR